MSIWKIEDGDIHYVCAATRSAAVALVAAHAGVTASEYDEVAVTMLSPEEARAIEVFDEDSDTRTTVETLARQADGQEYLCGSVW